MKSLWDMHDKEGNNWYTPRAKCSWLNLLEWYQEDMLANRKITGSEERGEMISWYRDCTINPSGSSFSIRQLDPN